VIVMSNGFHACVKTAAIVHVVLASAGTSALADELRGLVTSVDLAGGAIVVSRFDTRGEEEIKLGKEAVITMGGAKIGLGDLKADDDRSLTVRRETGVATGVAVDPMPGAPMRNDTIEMYFVRKTGSVFDVYLDKSRYIVPFYKVLVVETPYRLVTARDLAISYENRVPPKIVTKGDIDGKSTPAPVLPPTRCRVELPDHNDAREDVMSRGVSLSASARPIDHPEREARPSIRPQGTPRPSRSRPA